MQNDPLCVSDVQTGILYSFYRQFRRHGRAIRISDYFSAAQVHDRSQISPSFFLYMDIGNIRTPLLVDGFCFEITLQDIFLIIRNTSMGWYDGYISLLQQSAVPVVPYAFAPVLCCRVSRHH